MLDDLKYIHDRDAQDALGIAEKQWHQLNTVYDLEGWNDQAGQIENVVFAGMGGSALAALIATSWPKINVPFEICRAYDIPAYVGPKTLFIASSYSGNTEETFNALAQAEQKGAQLAIIASGGKLADIATENNYPIARLPDVGQPRFGALASLKALATILDKAGLNGEQNAANTLESESEFVKNIVSSWLPTVATKDNLAKQLALECIGKSPVIYAGPKLFPAAYKWKISFNENAKNIAWCNALPEFNHNEFLGWSSHPVDKPYAVIDLRSSLEHERIQKRFEVTDRLLSGKRPAAHVIQAQGGTVLEHLLWTIALGDFVSLYTALLNGLNPTPVDLIEKFKTSLDD
ncbi:bifunctional phosphoglucose/phosphomannose isomerase [Candidatus Saccharibacteria bacterium]|nr:bifunctional phosphoglucose/phosphomannose isomerase [Candidatus Saccharibacteria bacterium]